ncbi:MAG: response regulator [Nannocystaceae bacterium]|nr:response regulator [Nannocystaceae bacterium]
MATTERLQENDFSVLLVEDNPADVELTKRALSRGPLRSRIRVAREGASALQMLREGSVSVTTIGLVLLDLNLPGMSGFDVLREMKADKKLCRIPVVLLSTSGRQADVDRAYDLGAASYVVKPVDLDVYIETMSVIEAYWMRTVRLSDLR